MKNLLLIQALGKLINYKKLKYPGGVEEYLSTVAYTKIKKNEYQSKIIFLMPQSIYEEESEKLKEMAKDCNYELIDIPDISGKNINKVWLRIFNIIFEEFINNRIDEIILDISTGYNHYVVLCYSILKFIFTYNKIKNWNKSKLKIKLIAIPPASNEKDKEYLHEEIEEGAKVFFDIPDIEEYNISRAIKGPGEIKERIFKNEENFDKFKSNKPYEFVHGIFNCISQGIVILPLIIKTKVINLEEKELNINEEDLLNALKKIYEEVKDKEDLKVDKKFLENFILFNAFLFFFKEYCKELDERMNEGKDEYFKEENGFYIFRVNIEEFVKISGNKLIETFIKKETAKPKNELTENESIESFIKSEVTSSINDRNFFAHCGLLKNYTESAEFKEEKYVEVKIKKEEFEKPEIISNIKNFIKKPYKIKEEEERNSNIMAL